MDNSGRIAGMRRTIDAFDVSVAELDVAIQKAKQAKEGFELRHEVEVLVPKLADAIATLEAAQKEILFHRHKVTTAIARVEAGQE